jgi:hypothetical protein
MEPIQRARDEHLAVLLIRHERKEGGNVGDVSWDRLKARPSSNEATLIQAMKNAAPAEKFRNAPTRDNPRAILGAIPVKGVTLTRLNLAELKRRAVCD